MEYLVSYTLQMLVQLHFRLHCYYGIVAYRYCIVSVTLIWWKVAIKYLLIRKKIWLVRLQVSALES